MPLGTAFHERAMQLCESLNFREWSGYYAVSVYETHHEHEYNAIRNAAAMIDVSPLFKYRISGLDAAKFINHVITRDVTRRRGRAGDLLLLVRRAGKNDRRRHDFAAGENVYRWTAAEPNLRWFRQNALGLDVRSKTFRPKSRRWLFKGPTSARLLQAVAGAEIANLKYFRVMPARIAGVRSGNIAHRLHRRSGLRNLDSLERRAESLGRAHRTRAAPSICILRECWRWMWRASKPG